MSKHRNNNPSVAKFVSTDPMTGAVLWEGAAAGAPEVDAAMASATSALPEWSLLPMEDREKILKQYSRVLTQKREWLSETISQETGKPLWESDAEVGAMIGKVDISIRAQPLRCPDSMRQGPHGTLFTRHRPLGLVAVLGPFNFPGHLPNGHIVPALLAGNTVVFKPSELTPLVAERMAALWTKADLPEGVLNLVQGGGKTGSLVAQHPAVNALLFTGSWNTGRLLAEQFGKTPYKLLALEMGGNNPLIIDAIDDIEAAAYIALQSAFLTAGQRCTCARRILVPVGAAGDAFVKTFVEMAQGIKAGAYTDRPQPFMGPVITSTAADKLLATQKDLIGRGGNPLLEMVRLSQKTPLLSCGIIDTTAVAERPDEEYFGPLVQLIRTANFEEALAEANNTAYGLVASILTNDKQQYDRFYRSARAGAVNWNAPTTGASSESPFGGVGQSGNYRPSALYAADYCNYPVASIEAPAIHLPEKLFPGVTLKGKHT